MSITLTTPKIREVINQVVNDPDYLEVSKVPLISWQQIALRMTKTSDDWKQTPMEKMYLASLGFVLKSDVFVILSAIYFILKKFISVSIRNCYQLHFQVSIFNSLKELEN